VRIAVLLKKLYELHSVRLGEVVPGRAVKT